MKTTYNKQYLMKAVFCSLLISSSVYRVAMAADQPIEHSGGGTYNYDRDVNIGTISDTDPVASIWVSQNNTANFNKNVNLNLNTANWRSNVTYSTIYSSGTINIADSVNIYIDTTEAADNKSIVAIGSAVDKGLNIQGDLNLSVVADKGTIVGGAGYIDVRGTANINISATGDINAAYGYCSFLSRTMRFQPTIDGGTHNINIIADNLNNSNGVLLSGIYALDYGVTIGNNADVNISITNKSDAKFNDQVKGVIGQNLNIAGANSLKVKLDLAKNNTYTTNISDKYTWRNVPAGLYVAGYDVNELPTTYIEVSGAAIWDVVDQYGSKVGLGSVVGIGSLGTIEANKDVTVLVTSERGVGVRVDDFELSAGNISLNGNTVIMTNKGYALMSESVAGIGDYNERHSIMGMNPNKETSLISINKNGGKLVQIVGDLDHRALRDSKFEINMDTAESFLTGSSMKTNSAGFDYNGIHYSPVGTTDITLANGATWNMTGKSVNNISGDSLVDTLTLSNKGFLNMTPDGQTYENLTAGNLAGEDGRILMNTDLQQSFDNKDVMAESDRIVITDSSAGTHTVDIKDASLLTHIPSEGYLLLVEDQSQGNANFVGGELQKGGIFKYKPLITNEDPDIGSGYINSPANSSNWYLTGFEKGNIKEEVLVSAGLAESRYSSYMNEQDTLVKRLGELRQSGKEKGLWVRIRGANNSVEGVGINRNSYVSTHLGYD